MFLNQMVLYLLLLNGIPHLGWYTDSIMLCLVVVTVVFIKVHMPITVILVIIHMLAGTLFLRNTIETTTLAFHTSC